MEEVIVEIDENSGIPVAEQLLRAAEKLWGRGADIVPMGHAALTGIYMTPSEREDFERGLDETVAIMQREAEEAKALNRRV